MAIDGVAVEDENIEACPRSAPTCFPAAEADAGPAPPITARAARSMAVPAALQSAMLASLNSRGRVLLV